MKLITAALAILLASTSLSLASDPAIRIVGSSTVYPFTTAVAEEFGKTSGFPTPVVESTGTGGGFKLFCSDDEISVTNASRKIKQSEVDDCDAHNMGTITELPIGYDGIVIASSKDGPVFSLTKEQIFYALMDLAEPRPEKWSDIDPTLPDIKIEVLGPPPTSGTRDSFIELVMVPVAKDLGWSEDQIKQYVKIREDGAYIDAGENDNLIVQKLETNPNALGIFGYSFLEENQSQLQGASIDGVEPTYETIVDGSYPIARPLFVYFKDKNAETVPGLAEFYDEYASEKAIGTDGYLASKGLIPLN